MKELGYQSAQISGFEYDAEKLKTYLDTLLYGERLSSTSLSHASASDVHVARHIAQ